MDSWRERGFVPDSDEEDGFDSQERGVIVDITTNSCSNVSVVVSSARSERAAGPAGDESRNGSDEGNTQQWDDAGAYGGGHEAAQDDRNAADITEETVALVEEDMDLPLPLPDERPWTPDDDGEGVEPEKGKNVAGRARSTQGEESAGARIPNGLSTVGRDELSSTPRPKQQRGYWDIPSSSPDLLQLDHHSWRKRTLPVTATIPTPRSYEPIQSRWQDENVQVDLESSPLSSPLSSPRSSILGEMEQHKPREALDQTIEDLLPPLDIPEDILQQLDQPARRSLRQRNPIQLHPYLLEDAKYKSLMKARGLKPVRFTQHSLPPARAADDDSQEQDLGDDAGSTSDSQMTGLQYSPSAPSDTRQPFELRLIEDTVRSGGEQANRQPKHSAHNKGPRSPKRRRVIGPGDEGQRWRLRPVPRPVPPQVTIDKVLTPMSDASSIFDIPSPPRSGSVFSPPVQKNIGARYPLGFSPPSTTPGTATKKKAQEINVKPIILDGEENELDQYSDDSRTVRSVSLHNLSGSDPDGEDEDEDAQEAIVRRFQKKIKGVLPASWLRLDQQKQQGAPTATKRNHDRMAKLETEATKGVARKITKKANPSALSSARNHLSSIRQLAEENDEESGDDSDNAESIDDPQQNIARWFGFQDSIPDQELGLDGDIREDNRIDYMLPTASRNPTSTNSRKRTRKRWGPGRDGGRTGGQTKKPRLKRQARLTDAIYRVEREKRSSQNIPKLGILDVPDVASVPRKEQPQFLRIAARKARSRQDRGRHSPYRKVIRLNSRLDTEDANASLQEWRSGRMRQTTLPRVPSQTPGRQPLRGLSTNARHIFNGLSAKRAKVRNRGETRQATSMRHSIAAKENLPTVDAPQDVVQQATPTGNDNATEENVLAVNAPPDSGPNARGTATRPVQQRRGNAWIIQRNLAITSLSRNNPRPVVPEVGNHNSIARPRSSLQKSLALLARDDRLPLNRFLSGSEGHRGDHPLQSTPPATIDIDEPVYAPKAAPTPRLRQLKKRQPKRMDFTTSLENFYSSELETTETPTQSRAQLLHGRRIGQLSRFRTAYSIDFDVCPLHSGIFFHESTFIGSGEFSRSLDITRRDLDKSTSFVHLQLGDQSMRWGAWEDSVSSQLGMVFDKIFESAETAKTDEGLGDIPRNMPDSAYTAFRSVIRYVSEALSFVDPVDRVGFVTRANGLVAKLLEVLTDMVSATGHSAERLVKVASHNVVFANQVCQIASHSLVNQATQDETINLAKSASRQVIAFILNHAGQGCFRKFLAASRQRKLQEEGIKDDYPVVEAYVIVRHVLRSADRFRGCLEDFVAEAYPEIGVKSTEKDIDSLEHGWQQIFSSLPLQEIDALGISRLGSRFQGGHDNWKVVKRLLRPVLESDEADLESQPICYYNYCRVLFQRCFILINDWGWRDCKPILDTLYDFFAKRTLYDLKLEESYKSPAFLDELDRNPSFQVLPGDPCFHILLKVLASGLRFLTKAYDKKKIRNYTWRLLPNHGRDYPKEQPVHQADLDALRNHHDLLSVLYSSVPDGCRPRLGTIKNLVHPATSHRETCKISLRTWTRLARFKLSTKEDISGLEPFAEWHGYFVTEFLKQHSLARKEIEAQNNGGKQFSQQLIDRTVAQNQRQIESLLKTALQGLQSVIKCAPSLEHAQKVVSQTPIKSILDLFDSRTTRLNATVLEGLQVIVIYLQKCSLLTAPSTTSVANPPISADEDSQDYGDWTDIEAVYWHEFPPINPGIEHVEQIFHPAVSRLVSNCFGDDRCPDDAILLGVVDCWTSMAHTLVKHKLRRWDSYISPYEADSWVALRWTTQTRKFTPQFFAKCIEKDGEILSECKPQVLGMWLSSLVERISMLKFQHRFTEAILNWNAEDPVLRQLPFSPDPKEERYSITLTELSQRRLSLISSVLSNMRVHVQHLDDMGSRDLSDTRQEYKEVIQKMMSSMKSNYQELGNGEAEVKGAYVEFVQRIVGFLQQHTRDICPVDPFFTDTTTFPLPSKDPLYIVARLRSYEPKLASAKVAKTLVIFIQSVSERAALDGEQTYLVDQLFESMKNTYEAGNPEQPTLRAILLQGIFPAYLATAFSNGAAWIFSRPIIETVTRTFKELLFNIDATDPACVSSVMDIFCAIFEPAYKALHSIITEPDMLAQPTVLITITAFLEMITSALPIVNYIDRVIADTGTTNHVIAQIGAFQRLAIFIISRLQPQRQQSPGSYISLDAPLEVSRHSTSDLALSATRELQSYINESWSRHRGKYYFTRRGAHAPQEVDIEAAISAKLDHFPAKGLSDAATTLLDALDSLDMFTGSIDVVDRLQSDLPWVWSDELLAV
ncbi:Mus7/MMS22 family-domain-containing protein [Aspergillus desertorum]